jgi:acyl carrier protein
MIDLPNLHRRVIDIFDRMGLDVPSVDTDVFACGLLDSMSFVELLAALEQHFGFVFRLDDLEMDNFRSVRAIAAFLGGEDAATANQAAESA